MAAGDLDPSRWCNSVEMQVVTSCQTFIKHGRRRAGYASQPIQRFDVNVQHDPLNEQQNIRHLQCSLSQVARELRARRNPHTLGLSGGTSACHPAGAPAPRGRRRQLSLVVSALDLQDSAQH